MKRYQVYLNPNSVAVIDDFEEISDISRSKIIRRAIDAVAEQLIAIVAAKRAQSKVSAFDKMAGIIKDELPGPTNYSQRVDEIYDHI